MESASQGNWLAGLAIFAWPLIAIALYRLRPPAEATLWTLLGGYLLLPAGYALKLPMFPAFDKTSIPNACAFVGCLIWVPRRKGARVSFGLAELLAAGLVVGPVVTAMLNGDNIIIGTALFLPATDYYDGVSALLAQLIGFLPFFVGRRTMVGTYELTLIMRSLAAAGLVYSLPMLLEIRVSPQLSNWVYGYFPSGFGSEIRYGGYRPVVFMKNGLTAAFFLMTTFLASLALRRARNHVRGVPLRSFSPIWLAGILILCKSGGALIYALVAGPLVWFGKPRTQVRLAVLLVAISVLYPVLRLADLFPDQYLFDVASSVNQERADSLKFRFDQERVLLGHAAERLTFGWGRFGRNRVYDENGKDISITDGAWIQILGQYGLVGFFAAFGLFALGVVRASSSLKQAAEPSDQLFVSTLALIVAVTLVEQLPNSSFTSWNWFLAGALLGHSERLAQQARIVRSSKRALGVSSVPNLP